MAEHEQSSNLSKNDIGRPEYIDQEVAPWALFQVSQQLKTYQALFDEFEVTTQHISMSGGAENQLQHNQVDMVLVRSTEAETYAVATQFLNRLEEELVDPDLLSTYYDSYRVVRKLDDERYEMRMPIYRDFADQLGARMFEEGTEVHSRDGMDIFGGLEMEEGEEGQEGVTSETEAFANLLTNELGRVLYYRNTEQGAEAFEDTLNALRVLLTDNLDFKVRISSSEEITGRGSQRKIELRFGRSSFDRLQNKLNRVADLLEEEEFPPEAGQWLLYSDPEIIPSDDSRFSASWTIYQDYMSQEEFSERHGAN